MIEKFLAYRIVLGKLKFKDVPKSLKEKVKNILTSDGLDYLIDEE